VRVWRKENDGRKEDREGLEVGKQRWVRGRRIENGER
jgi:hypothetical protein